MIGKAPIHTMIDIANQADRIRLMKVVHTIKRPSRAMVKHAKLSRWNEALSLLQATFMQLGIGRTNAIVNMTLDIKTESLCIFKFVLPLSAIAGLQLPFFTTDRIRRRTIRSVDYSISLDSCFLIIRVIPRMTSGFEVAQACRAAAAVALAHITRYDSPTVIGAVIQESRTAQCCRGTSGIRLLVSIARILTRN
jgi:hypothetical protein